MEPEAPGVRGKPLPLRGIGEALVERAPGWRRVTIVPKADLILAFFGGTVEDGNLLPELHEPFCATARVDPVKRPRQRNQPQIPSLGYPYWLNRAPGE